MLVERFVKAEEIINKYLAQGYEVKQIIPNYSPSQQGEGNMTFYKAGITVYFEKSEISETELDEFLESTGHFRTTVDIDSSINEDVSISDVIEAYLDPTQKLLRLSLMNFLNHWSILELQLI